MDENEIFLDKEAEKTIVKQIEVLQKTQLFSGCSADDICSMLHCLGTYSGNYPKDECVFRRGSEIDKIAILIKGRLHIVRYDYWGNSNIINHIEVGEMFGEAYISPNSGTMMNYVIAAEDSSVMFFDPDRIISTCKFGCPHHTRVVLNLIYALSDKNRKLVQKLGHMSNRTTREKLMSYLSEESGRQNSSDIVIPFNRQQLADFLSVDRSAMSAELCKMRDDGLLTFNKNRFTLLSKASE